MDGKINTLLILSGIFTLSLLPTLLPGQSRDSLLARGARYHSLGVTNIINGELDSAVHYTQLAVRNREAALADNPDINLAKSNFNAGTALLNRSDFADARPFFERALAIYQTLDLPPDQRYRIPYSKLKVSEVLAGVGDFEAGKDQLQSALDYTRLPENDTLKLMAKIEADCYATLGGILFEQDMLTAAEKMLKKAIAQYDEEEQKGVYVDTYRRTTRLDLASVFNKLDNYEAAEAAYEKIIEEYKAYGEEQNLAIAANNLSDMRIRMGDLTGAERALAEGSAAARRANVPQYLAQAEDHYGALWLARGQPKKAAASFQQAQAILLPEYAPESILEAPPLAQLKYADNQTDLFTYLGDQARALDAMEGKSAGKATALSTLYRTGDALLDNLRQQYSGQASKFFWREKTAAFYESAIKHCHQANLPEDAFFFFEKSKAVLLYDAIRGSDALRELPDSLRQREKQLAQAVTKAQSKMGTSGEQDRIADLNAVISAQGKLAAFRLQLRNRFPRYRTLTEDIVVPEPAVFYQNTLDSTHQVLLHYFIGPTEAYALYLDQNGIRTFSLGQTDSLQEIAAGFLAYFSRPADIQNDPAGYAASAFSVYQAFLAPLELPARQPLLIIPDGPLTYLPFPALLTGPVTDAGQLGGLPYLLRRHPVSYGHSASILSRKRPDHTAGNQMVAFAPFVDGSAGTDYPPLPFSEDELQQVTKTFRVELLTSEAATLARFRERAVDANVLHLSTHAFASTEAGALPLIAFYDQPLFLREVYHQDLHADLVVLSACQSNIGQLARGEGVLGLGRGFIQAGAASVIASLWNVNARAGGRVLSDFYHALAGGETKGMALHLAQLGYLDDPTIRDAEKSPYLWAGLTYYGTETGLELQPATGGKWMLWGGLIALTTLGLVWLGNFRKGRSGDNA